MKAHHSAHFQLVGWVWLPLPLHRWGSSRGLDSPIHFPRHSTISSRCSFPSPRQYGSTKGVSLVELVPMHPSRIEPHSLYLWSMSTLLAPSLGQKELTSKWSLSSVELWLPKWTSEGNIFPLYSCHKRLRVSYQSPDLLCQHGRVKGTKVAQPHSFCLLRLT